MMGCGKIPLIDIGFLEDQFMSGVDHIELVGTSCARFHVYCDHVRIDGTRERIPARPIVVPLDCLPKAVRKVLRFMAERGIEVGRRELSRLVS